MNFHEPLCKANYDLDCGYGPKNHARKNSKHHQFALKIKKLNGHCRPKEENYVSGDIQTTLQKILDRKLNEQAEDWLEDIVITEKKNRQWVIIEGKQNEL